jgi:hypothetical protein
MIASVDSVRGSIGPFFWLNATCHSFQITGLYGLTSNLSKHIAWRQGGCGFVFGKCYYYIARPKLRILERLN